VRVESLNGKRKRLLEMVCSGERKKERGRERVEGKRRGMQGV
jgi:hypothetical protein